MKKAEILFVVSLLIPLIPMVIAKQWWLFSVFMVFYICFGLIEWLAVAKTDKSVSQHFWEFSKKNKVLAWIILGFMAVMWVSLLIHLGIKLI